MSTYNPWLAPTTPADFRAVRRFRRGGPFCNAKHAGYFCTLGPGHAGNHVASNSQWIVARWKRRASAAAGKGAGK